MSFWGSLYDTFPRVDTRRFPIGLTVITAKEQPMTMHTEDHQPHEVTNDELSDALHAKKGSTPEPAVLIRTRFVLDFLTLGVGPDDSQVAVFGRDDDACQLTIPTSKWIDLGNPAELTVSIVADNALEAEYQAELAKAGEG